MKTNAAGKPARKPLLKAFGLVILLLLIALGLGEWMGWYFLAKPAQKWLGQSLNREVVLSQPDQARTDFKLRLIGGIRLELRHVQVGAPGWSESPHLVQAKNLVLAMRYSDLLDWRMNPESALRIQTLKADFLDAYLERLADGRASWQLNPDKPPSESPPFPVFGLLAVKSGTVRYSDAPLDLTMTAQLALQEGAEKNQGLKVQAEGAYQKKKLGLNLSSSGVLPWVAEDSEPVPVQLNASLGGLRLKFDGLATDALHLQKVTGKFKLSGSSLATAGEALGLTLPNTPSFSTEGQIRRDRKTWHAEVASARIGSSQLAGEFVYEGSQRPSKLSGILKGDSLILADLGPTVGASGGEQDSSKNRSGKVLPDRPFNLPALRAMNADVAVDIQNFDLGSEVLKPLRPLRAHLLLKDGVLRIQDIVARTAQGQLAGEIQLDGTGETAAWNMDLQWQDIQLEEWLKVKRADNNSPYVTGELRGSAKLTGQGRSTADLLGSLKGRIRSEVVNGTLSHLVVEAAGLDAAEAFGVWFSGDKVLKMTCAVADLEATEGVLQPRVFVIDTQDSALWVNGRASMKTEALDLQVTVTPKDFSPLSLRTPLLVTGTLGSPDVSLKKGPIAGKVAGAALLALINPFAALLPFIDSGAPESKEYKNKEGCHDLAARARAQKAKVN